MSSVRSLESLIAIAARAKRAMVAPAATTDTAARRLFVARAVRQPRLHTRKHREHKTVRVTAGRFSRGKSSNAPPRRSSARTSRCRRSVVCVSGPPGQAAPPVRRTR